MISSLRDFSAAAALPPNWNRGCWRCCLGWLRSSRSEDSSTAAV